jgi:hypothetical protein
VLRGSDENFQAHPESEILRQLLVHFDNLPLAIAQAAAYIRETDITLPEYLKMFEECERNQQRLLSKSVRTIGDNTDSYGSARASRAVMTTWKITVDKIEQTSRSSAFSVLKRYHKISSRHSVPSKRYASARDH